MAKTGQRYAEEAYVTTRNNYELQLTFKLVLQDK